MMNTCSEIVMRPLKKGKEPEDTVLAIDLSICDEIQDQNTRDVCYATAK